MNEHAPDDRLSEFDAQLNRLKDEQSRRTGSTTGRPQAGYGMAFTIAADLVGGLLGGAGLGWLLDRWLDSSPLGMIVFFFLGAFAGMWNAFRTVRGYGMGLGFYPASAQRPGDRDDKETPAGARSEQEGGDHRGQPTPSIRSRTDHPD